MDTMIESKIRTSNIVHVSFIFFEISKIQKKKKKKKDHANYKHSVFFYLFFLYLFIKLFIYAFSHNNIQSLCKFTHALHCHHSALNMFDRTQC